MIVVKMDNSHHIAKTDIALIWQEEELIFDALSVCVFTNPGTYIESESEKQNNGFRNIDSEDIITS